MFLPFQRMPLLLRVLTVLLALSGIFRLGRWTIGWFLAEPTPRSLLPSGALYLYSAVLLFRGRRAGLDWMLGYCVLLLGLMAFGLWRSRTFETSTIVAVVVSIAICAYFAWCRAELPWKEPGSYGHWMSDPSYRSAVSDWFAERDRQLERDRLAPPDPEALVRGLLSDADPEMLRHRIQARPEHFASAVLRALGDRSFQRQPELLEMLIGVLPESRHVEALPQLSACLGQVGAEARARILRILASTGRASLAPLLVAELSGAKSHDVADGLEEALRGGRAEEALLREVEPSLRACVEREGCDHPAIVALARIDPSTIPRLVRTAMESDEDAVHGLAKIGAAGLQLPPEALALWRRLRTNGDWSKCRLLMPFVGASDEDVLQLLRELAPHLGSAATSAFEDPHRAPRFCYASALELLLDRRHAGIQSILAQAMDLELDGVSDRAARLLLQSHGLSTDEPVDDEREPTQPQRYLRALARADAYACNGGLFHAFDCLSETDLNALIPALEAVAPREVREPWMEALRAVAPSGLPADRERRQELLMQRYDELSARLDELSRAYYRCAWRLDVARCRYALLHRAELGP